MPDLAAEGPSAERRLRNLRDIALRVARNLERGEADEPDWLLVGRARELAQVRETIAEVRRQDLRERGS